MAIFKKILGRKKDDKTSAKQEASTRAELETEEAELIAAGILTAKPESKKTAPKEEPTEKEAVKPKANTKSNEKATKATKETKPVTPKEKAKAGAKAAAPKAEAKTEAKATATKAEAKTEAKAAAPKAEAKTEAKAAKEAIPQKKEAKSAAPKVETKNAVKKEDDSPAERTVEEIDASFKEASAEISEEASKAEEKSGRALAQFIIKKAKDGRFVFNLYAPNRVIVATSQIYSSSTSAVNGIKSIVTNAPKAPIDDTTLKIVAQLGYPKWEIYLDKGGQYRFRLYAPNGSCIVHSQGYTTKSSCKNGIASVIKNAPEAIIDKSYIRKA